MKTLKIAMALGIAAAASFSAAQQVIVGGQMIAFDAAPKMVNGTMMVPIKGVFEATGTDMRWRMDRQVIEGLRKGNKIEIWVGSRDARVNDKGRTMDEAPYVWRGRTYAPLKFLADSLGYMMSIEHGDFVLQEIKR